jgi:hypothetical protein
MDHSPNLKYGSRFPEALAVWLLSAFLALSVLFLYSLKFNRNITGFLVIGDYFQAPHLWTEKTLIHRGSVGYDGQFYYYIAHDPFLQGTSYDHIDFPAYRYQRILYPLTVWFFSLGQPKVIPWMMVIVNLSAYWLGIGVVLLILKHFGRSPWYALIYATFWGFLLCLLRSLPEPMAVTWLVVALFFYFKGRLWLQTLFLTLAALTQETTLLVSSAFIIHYWRKRDFPALVLTAVPPAGYLLWQWFLFRKFGTFSFLGGTQNFGFPFWGWVEKVLLLTRSGFSFERAAEGLYLFLILGVIFLAVFSMFREINPLTLSFMAYALMAVFYNHLIWVEPWSYARATLGLMTFHFLVFVKEGGKLHLYLLLPIPFIYLLGLLSMQLG